MTTYIHGLSIEKIENYDPYNSRAKSNGMVTDASSYMKEFKEYKNAGITLAIESGPALTNAINELSQFFSSAIYQTEKDSYMFKMQMYFDHIIVELFKQASHYECKSWGSLDIEKPKTTYARIF